MMERITGDVYTGTGVVVFMPAIRGGNPRSELTNSPSDQRFRSGLPETSLQPRIQRRDNSAMRPFSRVLAFVAIAADASALTQSEIDALLAAHNTKRTLHCVPEVTWDTALASDAQAWADTCASEHTPMCSQVPSDPHCRGPTTLTGGTLGETVGENMAWKSDDTQTGTDATNLWYDEYTDPGYSFDADGGGGGTPTGNSGTGHFTQVVWKTTTKIGCGYKSGCDYSGTSKPGMTAVWVCMYVRASIPRAGPSLCFTR